MDILGFTEEQLLQRQAWCVEQAKSLMPLVHAGGDAEEMRDRLATEWDLSAAETAWIMDAVEFPDQATFEAAWNAIERAVNDRFDVRGDYQADLISAAVTAAMIGPPAERLLAEERRSRYRGKVPDPVFEFIEEQTRRWFNRSSAPEKRLSAQRAAC